MENKHLRHRLLLLNGPNMNLLGRRDPAQYGHWTLADVEDESRKAALARGYGLDAFQSNYEGKLVDLIQEARWRYDGILLNAAALTHYSVALRDAIDACGVPVIEVHMSDIKKREPFRQHSVIEPVCRAQISGLGLKSYLVAVDRLCDLLEGRNGASELQASAEGRAELPESPDTTALIAPDFPVPDTAVQERSLSARPELSSSAPDLQPTGPARQISLEELRIKLSGIDESMLNQFVMRTEIVRQVAAYKRRKGLPVLDLDREAVVAARARTRYPSFDGMRAESLVKSLMRLSREAQYDDIEPEDRDWALGAMIRQAPTTVEAAGRIVCQGSAGAYSMSAGKRLFPDAELLSAATFAEACAMVLDGRADLAVLPWENSTAGTVDDVYDLLQANRLYIVQSASLSIGHRLMAAPGTRIDQIRTVISHPQALSQCQNYISRHGWKILESTNTAHAAAAVSENKDPTRAAIASAEAALIHGLDILAEDINDRMHNQTRFIVVGRTLVIPPEADRVSLILSTPHQSGSLASTLSMFGDRGVNLLKIQSRPDPDKAWNYRFHIDFESLRGAREAMLVLYQLDREMPYLQLLGWYRESDRPEFG